MSTRVHHRDFGDSAAHSTLPGQGLYWPLALRAAVDDQRSLLNPRASDNALMCNDVLELVRQRVVAPRLHAMVRRGGSCLHEETFTAAQAHMCAYDFDAGWSDNTVEIAAPDRGCKLYTLSNELCRCVIGQDDVADPFEMRRLRDNALMCTLPRWTTVSATLRHEYGRMIPGNREFFYCDDRFSQLVAAMPNAESVGPVVELPHAMQWSRVVLFVDPSCLFFSSYWRHNGPGSHPTVSWGWYDLCAAQVAQQRNDFVMPSCSPSCGMLCPLNPDTFIALAWQYMHRIDVRCDRTQQLCPLSEEAAFLMQFLDETVWLALASNGVTAEYDARADRWRQPHTRLPLLSDHFVMDSVIACSQ